VRRAIKLKRGKREANSEREVVKLGKCSERNKRKANPHPQFDLICSPGGRRTKGRQEEKELSNRGEKLSRVQLPREIKPKYSWAKGREMTIGAMGEGPQPRRGCRKRVWEEPICNLWRRASFQTLVPGKKPGAS